MDSPSGVRRDSGRRERTMKAFVVLSHDFTVNSLLIRGYGISVMRALGALSAAPGIDGHRAGFEREQLLTERSRMKEAEREVGVRLRRLSSTFKAKGRESS